MSHWMWGFFLKTDCTEVALCTQEVSYSIVWRITAPSLSFFFPFPYMLLLLLLIFLKRLQEKNLNPVWTHTIPTGLTKQLQLLGQILHLLLLLGIQHSLLGMNQREDNLVYTSRFNLQDQQIGKTPKLNPSLCQGRFLWNHWEITPAATK